MKKWVGVTLTLAVCSLRLPAQQPAAAFEVASIRLHTAPLRTIMGRTVSGPRITLEGYTIPMLIMEAYGLRGRWQLSLSSLPARDDLQNLYYDVAARAPGDTPLTRDDFRAMLQTLMKDRFQLSVHRETKEIPVYALVTGKNGAKLTAGTKDGDCGVNVGVVAGGQSYSFANCPIDKLVDMLGNGLVDRAVIDKTELTGTYSFRLVILPAFMKSNQPDAAEASPFTAVQALGLKLEGQRSAIEIVNVDHVEKPSEN